MKEHSRERQSNLEEISHKQVTETVRLAPGRKFYDQYPFQDVFGQVAERYSKSTSLDKAGVQSDISCAVSSLLEDVQKAALHDRDFDRTRTLEEYFSPRFNLSHRLPQPHRPQYQKIGRFFLNRVMKDVFNNLEPYPDWQEYATTQRMPALYDHEGKFNSVYDRSKMIPEDLPPTYLEWVTTRKSLSKRMNNRIIVDTLAETFPQQASVSGSESGAIARATWDITGKGVAGSPLIIRRIPKTQT